MLAHGMGEPGVLVARAEEFYARHGVAARFQITPAACPDTLDGLLEGRGYHLHTPMSLRVAETGAVAAWESTVDVRVEERLTPAWLDVWRAVQGRGGDAGAQRRLLERVAQPSAYAVARIGDDVVAVGRAVEDTGWVGVFGMVTLPQARGRGAAGAVLGALAKWAASRGTERIYLQVERENPAAVRLYERAGFAEAGRFHYRG